MSAIAGSGHLAGHAHVAIIDKPSRAGRLHEPRFHEVAQTPSQKHVADPIPTVNARHRLTDYICGVHEFVWASIQDFLMEDCPPSAPLRQIG
jgi:hypothetical protein